MEWNKEKTLYFIEKYKEETLLWNPAHPEHYNKLKKEDAWDRLASLLDSEREACKKKMTSLLASLRREKQKTKQSTGTGKGADEVYHSTWFAYKSMLFLLDRNTPRDTTDTAELHREMRKIREEREVRRARRTSIWDFEGFDVFEIRWMLEGRTGEIHPDNDWDHPVWSTPEGVMGAYDANY